LSRQLPPNEVTLLKLVWHPDDVDDTGTFVKPTAFRKEDLTGQNGSHVSVDRSDLADRQCMESLAAKQAEKANGQNIVREQAKIGCLPCEAVRNSEHEGTKLFLVSPFEVAGNPAHCGIHSNIEAPRRATLDQMRGRLAQLASPPAHFDEAYSKDAKAT
jgi:hypothetical protein